MKAKIMKAGRGAWGRIGLGNKAGMEMVKSALFPLIFNDFQTCSTVMARSFFVCAG